MDRGCIPPADAPRHTRRSSPQPDGRASSHNCTRNTSKRAPATAVTAEASARVRRTRLHTSRCRKLDRAVGGADMTDLAVAGFTGAGVLLVLTFWLTVALLAARRRLRSDGVDTA